MNFIFTKRISLIMGFALPWRLAIATPTGWLHPSLFDLLLPLLLLGRAFLRLPSPGRCPPAAAPLILFALLALHPLRPAAPLAAAATVWAALAGLMLARFDLDAILRGLEIGLGVSLLTGLALLPFAPETVTAGGHFTAFVASKNGLAAFAGLLAIRRAIPAGRSNLLVSLVWFGVVLATGSRGASLATLGAALGLALDRDRAAGDGRRARLLWLIAVAGGAFGVLGATTFPPDRYEFASQIIAHRRHIPLLGIGAGANYGLDLYAKSLLEFGWIGAALLAALLALALRGRATRPLVVFLLIFGIAHDPTRWPLFWLLLARGSIGKREPPPSSPPGA